MVLLNALLTPDIGLMFWTVLIFLLLLFILRKFAWKPIVEALKAREESIEKALNEAKIAREEIAGLKAENERIMKEARAEREKMLKEAREKGEQLIREAKQTAENERKKLLAEAHQQVKAEKDKAFQDLKKDITNLVIETAEKILRQELSDKNKYKQYIEENIKNLS